MAQDLFYPNGKLKAKLVHILSESECPCKWEDKLGHFTDGDKVYLKASYID